MDQSGCCCFICLGAAFPCKVNACFQVETYFSWKMVVIFWSGVHIVSCTAIHSCWTMIQHKKKLLFYKIHVDNNVMIRDSAWFILNVGLWINFHEKTQLFPVLNHSTCFIIVWRISHLLLTIFLAQKEENNTKIHYVIAFSKYGYLINHHLTLSPHEIRFHFHHVESLWISKRITLHWLL